tara:strand:+ start:2393 stop:2893 length:501 start_codon:yes stop_codon:yes gene_type:complete
MSYILDALQKAERERRREEPKELEDFVSANWNPYEPEIESTSAKTLGAVVVLLLLLIGLGSYWLLVKPISDSVQPLADVLQQAPESAPVIPQTIPEFKMSGPIPLPVMVVSGHMFIAEASVSNRLFTGQRTLRAGDRIDQNWILLTIDIGGFRVRNGERTEYIPYR